MFRYINMPKLVATYLREFSTDNAGKPSNLYKFIFCVCLPFVSSTFRRARLNALAIAECTNSADQISRVLNVVTRREPKVVSSGAEVVSIVDNSELYVEYEYEEQGYASATSFTYDATDSSPNVPYGDPINSASLTIRRNGVDVKAIEGYLALLVPFYVSITKITYVE